MDLFVIAFLIIILVGIKPMRNNVTYIGIDSTTAIKGIFAIIILFNHSRQYLNDPVTNWGEQSYTFLFNSCIDIFGQLMVVMFLTYSGYGIMESYKKKKKHYLHDFVKKRVLKTLINFDLAVFLFLILAISLGHQYTPKEYILSFIGWESIGNSNWFIFDIIILYLIAFISLKFSERYKLNVRNFLWLIFVLCMGFLIIMYKVKSGEMWWYDTILSFPIGLLWSAYKESIQRHLKNQKNYVFWISTITILFLATYFLGHNFKALFLFICAPIFAVLVILITMRLKIGNKVLYWLGVNAFAIYVLQRVPMIIARELNLHLSAVLFFSIVLPSTLLIAWFFTLLTKKLDTLIFQK